MQAATVSFLYFGIRVRLYKKQHLEYTLKYFMCKHYSNTPNTIHIITVLRTTVVVRRGEVLSPGLVFQSRSKTHSINLNKHALTMQTRVVCRNNEFRINTFRKRKCLVFYGRCLT